MMAQAKVTRSRVKPKMFDLALDNASAKDKSCWRPSSAIVFRVALALAIVLVVSLVVVFFDRIQYACVSFLELVASLGYWGMILLGLANILGSVLLLPSLIFTLAAGFLYGVVAGTILISVSCTLSMMTSFLIARHLARTMVERNFGTIPRFQLIDRAIRDEGFVLVLLIRCSPVHPFAILNYLLGVTSISFSDYTVASFVGMFPSTVMEVFFGSGLKNVADLLVGHVNKQDEQFSRVYFWIGLAITVVSTLWVTIWVKRKLDVKLQVYQTVDRDSDERVDLIELHSSAGVASSGASAAIGHGMMPPASPIAHAGASSSSPRVATNASPQSSISSAVAASAATVVAMSSSVSSSSHATSLHSTQLHFIGDAAATSTTSSAHACSGGGDAVLDTHAETRAASASASSSSLSASTSISIAATASSMVRLSPALSPSTPTPSAAALVITVPPLALAGVALSSASSVQRAASASAPSTPHPQLHPPLPPFGAV